MHYIIFVRCYKYFKKSLMAFPGIFFRYYAIKCLLFQNNNTSSDVRDREK